jgi:hypothetical protein
MQTLNKNDIVPILKESMLADQFEDEIVIPKKYVLNEINITNEKSFYMMMDKLRYYMIKKLPYEIYDYVDKNKLELSNFKDFFFKELSFLKETNKRQTNE